MRVLLFDIDTLRYDHLGCYGYRRNTSPNIDQLAQDAMLFNNYYCSDAPCLPSRAALLTGQFGIHTGVVGHGGTAADLRLKGASRLMFDLEMMQNLFWQFRMNGMHTASVSSFSERHSAYWFNAGLNEVMNVGDLGNERAEKISEQALDWLDRKGKQDNWFLHVHYWDPHTPYRTPDELDHMFDNDPLPEWMTKEVFEEHRKTVGPHSLNELNGFQEDPPDIWKKFDKWPGKVSTWEEYKHLYDLYDCGVYYSDLHVGKIIDWLKDAGLYEDTVIILTADHGENMGELGIYSEHGSADEPTCHIPMIVKWPGMATGVDDELRYNIDLLPTIAELFGHKALPIWDGKSFAGALKGEECKGYDYLVVSQCAHVCQRSVRFGDYYYIRTYHDGLHEFPKEMLFNIRQDPYERHDLVAEQPDKCGEACRNLIEWEQEQMARSRYQIDPLWTVIKEGGPFHAQCDAEAYYERLKATGRAEGAERLKARHPELF